MNDTRPDRRSFLNAAAAAAVTAVGLTRTAAADPATFRLRYALATSMYGTTKLADILPEVTKSGAEYLDVWPKPHGDQREQMDAMGLDAFAALLEKHKVNLGMLTRYDLGPFNLQAEMEVAKTFGARMIVCGSSGPKGLTGQELKAAVGKFVEQMKPHTEAAEKHGVTIAIENHANSLIDSPDSLRRFAELSPSKYLGIALAPYHLPQKPDEIAALIRDCGSRITHFYAWEHGKGSTGTLTADEQLLQMPGRGDLDFAPILAALKKIDYSGWTQVFMHPIPRGVPIRRATADVTAEINRSRSEYLEPLVKKL